MKNLFTVLFFWVALLTFGQQPNVKFDCSIDQSTYTAKAGEELTIEKRNVILLNSTSDYLFVDSSRPIFTSGPFNIGVIGDILLEPNGSFISNIIITGTPECDGNPYKILFPDCTEPKVIVNVEDCSSCISADSISIDGLDTITNNGSTIHSSYSIKVSPTDANIENTKWSIDSTSQSQGVSIDNNGQLTIPDTFTGVIKITVQTTSCEEVISATKTVIVEAPPCVPVTNFESTLTDLITGDILTTENDQVYNITDYYTPDLNGFIGQIGHEISPKNADISNIKYTLMDPNNTGASMNNNVIVIPKGIHSEVGATIAVMMEYTSCGSSQNSAILLKIDKEVTKGELVCSDETIPNLTYDINDNLNDSVNGTITIINTGTTDLIIPGETPLGTVNGLTFTTYWSETHTIKPGKSKAINVKVKGSPNTIGTNDIILTYGGVSCNVGKLTITGHASLSFDCSTLTVYNLDSIKKGQYINQEIGSIVIKNTGSYKGTINKNTILWSGNDLQIKVSENYTIPANSSTRIKFKLIGTPTNSGSFNVTISTSGISGQCHFNFYVKPSCDKESTNISGWRVTNHGGSASINGSSFSMTNKTVWGKHKNVDVYRNNIPVCPNTTYKMTWSISNSNIGGIGYVKENYGQYPIKIADASLGTRTLTFNSGNNNYVTVGFWNYDKPNGTTTISNVSVVTIP
ncbi:hypothetical protein UJ101_01172 [Flavobacteriaceae bacterium UJ101]|nr:hypothetical protein UJ101_01172 [Flavobacteriaceae bacterium UJ101]